MRKIVKPLLCAIVLLVCAAMSAQAGGVQPMYGSSLIDGYEFGKDIGPKGSIRYDEKNNEFVGYYTGLKMPAGRRAIFAWVHDTVNQRSRYVGPVGWLKRGSAANNKGRFTIKLPGEFKGGKFGSYEILGFSSEKTGFLNGTRVVQRPKEPAASKSQPTLKPAFYLFAKLPGADTELHYCGHGQDFTYVKAPDKQYCYDCFCGQKYTSCIAAGLAAH